MQRSVIHSVRSFDAPVLLKHHVGYPPSLHLGIIMTTPVFSPPVINPFGLADVGQWVSPTFADIDSDGDLDAFVGELYGNTLYFRNIGTASNPVFAAPVNSLLNIDLAPF